MNETNYRIKFRKGDVEIEVQGDKAWVEAKFKELTSKEVTIAGAKIEKREGLPGTLGEFLDMKGNPKKHTDTTAAFAYWLLKAEEQQMFNVDDMLERYDRTRSTKPGSIHVAMTTNVKRHVFAEATEKKDGKKAWIITRKGEEHVEQMK